MTDADELRVAGSGERWRIEGGWRAAGRQLCNDYLSYLAACRAEHREGQHDNVISLASGRASGFAPATINRRLAAISGLFSFRSMRDPGAPSPVPRGAAARRTARGERTGLLGHLAKPKPR